MDLQTPYVLNLLYGVTISAILLETSTPYLPKMAQLTHDKLIHKSIRHIDTHTLPIIIIQWFNYLSVSILVIVIAVSKNLKDW